MKGVKLYSTRHTVTLAESNDWYKSRDYYGWASQLAKRHCKKYPDVDKDIVYMAASEAAEFYERGGARTGARFETVVWVKIRTALLEQKKRRALIENKEEKMIDEKTKVALIEGAKKGMTSGELAIKYRMTAKTVQYHLTKARKSGLLPASKKHKGEARVDPAPFVEKPAEAYPGQITDEDTPKYDEHELEFEKKIEELAAKNDARPRLLPKPDDDFAVGTSHKRRGSWYAMLEKLEFFAVGAFGSEIVFDSATVSTDRKSAMLNVLTPDGKKVRISVEELGE